MSKPLARGFTYLMLLWWVTIGSVMLAALGQQWGMASRRERDTELAFRGEQIRVALEAYAQVPVLEGQRRLPMDLRELLEDQRSGVTLHHLRRAWPDPVTGRDWGLIRHQPDGGIKGVYSLSRRKPVRPPAGVASYKDWRFEAATP